MLQILRLIVTLTVLAYLASTTVAALAGDDFQRQTAAALADHDARLRQTERYHQRLEDMGVGERLARLEARSETNGDLLLGIALAIGLILLKEVVAVIRGIHHRPIEKFPGGLR